MRKKRVVADIYTHGKFGNRIRETLDTGNPYLYSEGTYPTKLTDADMPEWYIPIHSRSIWYMTGFLRTSGIVDMDYTYCEENHLFKDDYIYISYKEKLRTEKNRWGFDNYVNADVHISGGDIVNIVLAAEKYSGFDTTEVRRKIEEKRVWLRDNEPGEYKAAVGEDEDIFTLWTRRGYILERLHPER
jgi:hypothetical protein